MKSVSEKTVGKLVSLATLLVGLAIGFAGGVLYHPQQDVQAQAIPATTPVVQDVYPGMTTATFGSNLILAHEIYTDALVVNGFDIMKMQQNILNYLGTRPQAEHADIQNIINASRAAKLYRVKEPSAPPPQNPPSSEKPK